MIIGFAGKAASGKTTAAKQLAALLGCEVMIVPMAMVLRDEVETFFRQIGAEEYVPLVYGCQEDKVRKFYVDEAQALDCCEKWSHYIEKQNDIQDRPGWTAVTVRRILQWWGTEYRRAQDPDYWTKAWEQKVAGYDIGRTYLLVDDVRFINELNAVNGLGGRIVKIERPGFAAGGDHTSETSLDGYHDWDHVIVNDGTLEQFNQMVDALAPLLVNPADFIVPD